LKEGKTNEQQQQRKNTLFEKENAEISQKTRILTRTRQQ